MARINIAFADLADLAHSSLMVGRMLGTIGEEFGQLRQIIVRRSWLTTAPQVIIDHPAITQVILMTVIEPVEQIEVIEIGQSPNTALDNCEDYSMNTV